MARFARMALLLAVVPSTAAADMAGRPGTEGSAKAGVCKELQQEAGAGAVATELLQRGSSHRHAEGALSQPAAAQQIPGWDDLVDAASAAVNSTVSSASKAASSIVGSLTNATSINDAINSVTGSLTNSSSITDAIDSVTGSLTNSSSIDDAINGIINSTAASMSSVSGALANSAAAALAAALNQTLTSLGVQMDTFTDACEQAKYTLTHEMNKTKADAAARVAILEANATTLVSDMLPKWDLISAAVMSSSSLASVALDSVGLIGLSAKLNTSLTAAVAEANAMTVSLRNVSGLFANISNLAEQELSEQLALVQDTLQTGLEQADSFARNLSLAFGDLTDEAAAKIAATIPGANATSIDAIFDAVDATVAELAAKAVSGPEALVSGLSEATALVGDTLPKARSSAPRAQSLAIAGIGALLGLAAFAL